MKLTDPSTPYPLHSAHGHSLKLKRFMLRSCLDVVLTSLSLVMAGTGNLQVFKRLRQLHLTRLTTDYTYGNHMATHMAMGLLFLGGGRFTVSTSLKSIACLLCSLYPKYPLSTSDNRSHLQAVRHLWVLAVTDRCLVTMDVESQKLCSVPIIIKLKRIISSTDNDVRNNSSNNKINDFLEVSMTTPCILPDFSNLVAIRINSTRYWSLSIDSVRNRDHWRNALESRIIYVKRKIGSLDYMQVRGKKRMI